MVIEALELDVVTWMEKQPQLKPNQRQMTDGQFLSFPLWFRLEQPLNS